MTLKIEAGKKYRTRGGEEVEILRTNINCSDPVVGVITYKSTGGQSILSILSFLENGSYLSREEHRLDLISEILPKRVVWLNVYGDGGTCYASSPKKEADRVADPSRVACIRLEFEEGQFDNE